MRYLFIALFVFILLALTAIRYRRQINAAIAVTRMIRDATRSAGQIPTKTNSRQTTVPEPLVKCANCGMRIPESRAKRSRNDFFCSDVCRIAKARA